jgi:hypothetical protein
VNGWLKRCPTWQYALFWAAALGAGCLVGGIVGQLGRPHLDWSELSGLAAGGALGASVAAALFRHTQQRS